MAFAWNSNNSKLWWWWWLPLILLSAKFQGDQHHQQFETKKFFTLARTMLLGTIEGQLRPPPASNLTIPYCSGTQGIFGTHTWALWCLRFFKGPIIAGKNSTSLPQTPRYHTTAVMLERVQGWSIIGPPWHQETSPSTSSLFLNLSWKRKINYRFFRF